MFAVFSILLISLSLEVCKTESQRMALPPINVPKNAHMCLHFDSSSDLKKFVLSEAEKEGADEAIARYADGKWDVDTTASSALNDYGLIMRSANRHHAISYKMQKPFHFNNEDELVFQYEIKLDTATDCSGAYAKLLSDASNLKQFTDKTPYTIMFGPDKCTAEKIHFIIRYKDPKTGSIEEKHARLTPKNTVTLFDVGKTHLYTLWIQSNNDFKIYVDMQLYSEGNLVQDLSPSMLAPKEIDDPTDSKPSNWDDRETIPDPESTKPDDWDESEAEYVPDDSAERPSDWLTDVPAKIPDPESKKPDDWDNEMDGEWSAQLISNPECSGVSGCGEWTRPNKPNPKFKGKWTPASIDNPAYKGVWEPRKIPNPDYVEVLQPFKTFTSIEALGLELWTTTGNIVFDNFLLVNSKKVADQFAKDTWVPKHAEEERTEKLKSKSVIEYLQETFKASPWIFSCLGLLASLPIWVCCYYCVFARNSSRPHPKKTDAVTPDVGDEKLDDQESEVKETASGDESCEVVAPNGDGASADARPSKAASDEDSGSLSSEEDETDTVVKRLRPRKCSS